MSEPLPVSIYDLMSDPDAKDRCGGCQSLGSHRRWCRVKVGTAASIYGPMAEQLEHMGDRMGPNNMALANRLYGLSADVKAWAVEQITTPSAQESR